MESEDILTRAEFEFFNKRKAKEYCCGYCDMKYYSSYGITCMYADGGCPFIQDYFEDKYEKYMEEVCLKF